MNIFFCSSWDIYFSFSAVTLALVQILLSFSNDDDYCMVWCLLYLSRDGVFHLKDFALCYFHGVDFGECSDFRSPVSA